jgi:hypothetical protein
MTPERAMILARAIADLGHLDDAQALIAARATANLIAAEGIKPNALASGIATLFQSMTRPLPARGFAELGPRGGQKRMAALARKRSLTDDDRARVAMLRERLAGWPRDDFSTEEIAWLDALWAAAETARARKAG